jgi:hypothetical protein
MIFRDSSLCELTLKLKLFPSRVKLKGYILVLTSGTTMWWDCKEGSCKGDVIGGGFDTAYMFFFIDEQRFHQFVTPKF